MSRAWPEEAVWLRFAAPMMVMGSMPLVAALAPGFVIWRHAVAGAMLASGLAGTGVRPAPLLRAVARTEAPGLERRAAPGRRRGAVTVALVAVRDAGREA